MTRFAAAIVAATVAVALGPSSAALAQSDGGTQVLPSPSTAADQARQALEISRSFFGSGEPDGPRQPIDEAYGAFQRGYYLTALALALPRAESGDAAAQTLIAEIYANGHGVAENPARASTWYALAVENGDLQATFQLALLYQEGRGVPQNRERAAELIGKAAAGGHLAARYNLALLHIEGRYAEPDLRRAAELLRETAEAGLTEAQYDYGTVLLEGAGVAPDPEEGARYVGLAAAGGDIAAQIEYATLLYLGRGVPRDVALAATWYRTAAEAGNPVAQVRLAKLLVAGEGVERDLVEAGMWRSLARRAGLLDRDLNARLEVLTPGQAARAEERARFWPNRPPLNTTSVPGPADPEAPAPEPATAGDEPTAG